MKKYYTVCQGVLNEHGTGDMDVVATVDTLQEARKIYDKVKRDTKGWVKKYAKNYLATWVCENDEGEPLYVFNLKF